ncbi:hypothetical protein PMKS-002572 [Pichia membranifaciens]|uniref:Uncharacterized protein n=1 Tax=Pichia membranifaciens TaxID=4926 RepID=A0A1Q2YHT8_9ASCO|nr:hypothetical protein PMKS-002572 [Pichia membranifaciens]
MEQPTNNVFQFQQQLQMNTQRNNSHNNNGNSSANSNSNNNGNAGSRKSHFSNVGNNSNHNQNKHRKQQMDQNQSNMDDLQNHNISNASPQILPQRSQTLPFSSSSANSLSMINEYSNNMYQNPGTPQYSFANFTGGSLNQIPAELLVMLSAC